MKEDTKLCFSSFNSAIEIFSLLVEDKYISNIYLIVNA